MRWDPEKERQAELEQAKKQRDRAVAALRGVMVRIEDGTLCRDISRDHEATWPLRMMELVQNLKEAQEVLASMPERQER